MIVLFELQVGRERGHSAVDLEWEDEGAGVAVPPSADAIQQLLNAYTVIGSQLCHQDE